VQLYIFQKNFSLKKHKKGVESTRYGGQVGRGATSEKNFLKKLKKSVDK